MRWCKRKRDSNIVRFWVLHLVSGRVSGALFRGGTMSETGAQILAPPPHMRDVNSTGLDGALDAFGAFLADKGWTGWFGVQICHSHFPWDDKILVQVPAVGGEAVVTTMLMSVTDAASAGAVTWDFTAAGEPVETVRRVGYVPRAGAKEALVEIGAFMANAGLIGRFSVVVLDWPFRMGPDDITFEVTDERNRRQTTVVVPRVDADLRGAATWRFDKLGHWAVFGTCHFDGTNHQPPAVPAAY
jgi:hypothetical protein